MGETDEARLPIFKCASLRRRIPAKKGHAMFQFLGKDWQKPSGGNGGHSSHNGGHKRDDDPCERRLKKHHHKKHHHKKHHHCH
jgi:hypothetical protein